MFSAKLADSSGGIYLPRRKAFWVFRYATSCILCEDLGFRDAITHRSRCGLPLLTGEAFQEKSHVFCSD